MYQRQRRGWRASADCEPLECRVYSTCESSADTIVSHISSRRVAPQLIILHPPSLMRSSHTHAMRASSISIVLIGLLAAVASCHAYESLTGRRAAAKQRSKRRMTIPSRCITHPSLSLYICMMQSSNRICRLISERWM